MKHLMRFNESDKFTKKQYFWVRHKGGGEAIISEREMFFEDGEHYTYWNFIGSDKITEESEFVKYFDIVKEIEQV